MYRSNPFKYPFLTLVLLLASTNILAQEAIWTIGGGPSVELDNGLLGVNTRAYFGPNETICFGPEIAFFPYGTIEEELELRVLDVNFNGHYIVEVAENLGFYALTGINYTIEDERQLESLEVLESKRELGWNYGLGLHYQIDNWFLFAEFKGIAGALADEFMTIGLFVTFSGKNKEAESE